MKFSVKFQADSCNCRIKLINNEPVEYLLCSKDIWHPCGEKHTSHNGKYISAVDDNVNDDKKKESTVNRKSVNRAKRKLFDYVMCNADMKYFVTLTLDKTKIDRYDYSVIIKKLNTWLDNKVRRNGLKYVLVPELHKDGALHFHGFFNDVLRKEDSTHRYNDGRVIYNLPQWTYGFTTAIECVGERAKIANYCCKYVVKQLEDGKIGGRFYLSGGKLIVPEYEYGYVFWDEVSSCDEFKIEEAGLSFKIVRDYTHV